MKMRDSVRWLPIGALTAAVLIGGGTAFALFAPQSRRGDSLGVADLELRAETAVSRGLEYLKSHQQADGSWRDIIGRKVHTKYQGTDGKHVGVTALACMAFLANGSLPGRGKYGEQIERGLEFILGHVEPNGYITNESSRMYSHAFATLFLAEIYGMTGMERVEDALKSAINLIVHAQNPQGGWRYQPGAPDADMSITVCQVMALRAAQNAGVHVPKRTIDEAIRYVNNSYRADEGGGFTYQIEDGMASRVTLALTAAGVTALYGAGVYDDPRIENGLEYIQRNLPSFTRNYGGPRQRFDYYYGIYYATQAAFQRGGDYWDRYQKQVWADLLRQQDARTNCWEDLVGRNYATAVACVVLQIPRQYLPIFER
ncbi:MAG: prenyltransferase/squalene oxidase repeat-containing protein [Planctomycetota bacterium]